MDSTQREGCVQKLHSHKKLQHLYIFAHWNLPRGISIGKKSEVLLQCSQYSFISEFSGVSDLYHSASAYLATFSERGLQLDVLCGRLHIVNAVMSHFSSFTKRRCADPRMMFYKVIVYRIADFSWL